MDGVGVAWKRGEPKRAATRKWDDRRIIYDPLVYQPAAPRGNPPLGSVQEQIAQRLGESLPVTTSLSGTAGGMVTEVRASDLMLGSPLRTPPREVHVSKLPLAPLAVGILVAAVGWVAVGATQATFRQSLPDGLSDEYDEIAINLVEHGRYSADLTHWERSTVTRGPAYPLYLAAVFRVFGLRNLGAAARTDMLLYALTAGLLTATLQTFVAAPAAAAGGLVFAFWPTTFYFAVKGSSETLLDLLLVASLGALVLFRARPGRLRAAALGACLGLACLARGSAVVLLAVAVVWAVARAARRELPWSRVAVVVLAWALTMSPWWIRNARVSGEFVPFHSLTWYNAYHDDVFDRTKQWLASQGMGGADWSSVDRARLPASLPSHPAGSVYPAILDARADLAQERMYRTIMLGKFRSPGYLMDKLLRNAVDFWSAAASATKGRKLLVTSIAWLSLYAAGLSFALRQASQRWLAQVCLAFVVLTWALYLPFLALFRHSIPTAPFIAATLGPGLWAAVRRGWSAISPASAAREVDSSRV